MLGDGAAARAGVGAPGPSFAPGDQPVAAGPGQPAGLICPDTAWPQSIPMERKKITFIRLCIKLIYWCYAAALGIEKNGKV